VRGKRYLTSLAVVVGLVMTAGPIDATAGDVTVTIDSRVRHQTIRGWSANPWYPHIAPKLRDQLLDEAVNELGLTRLRWGQPNGNRSIGRSWEWENDDGDPNHINWAAFNTAWVDRFVALWVRPFKERVEASGLPFELWVSPSFFDGGSTGAAPAWIEHSPGEYAEFATSFLLYLKEKHGIEATHYVILNEAGNNNRFSPDRVGAMIRALGPRLKALGLKTTVQFPDGVNAGVSWRYIQRLKDAPGVWPYVTVLSYHLYGAKDPYRAHIRDFARSRGMVTGQTEFMSLNIDHLYDDLTKGGTSYWSIYGLAGAHAGGQNFRVHLSNTSFSRGRRFWTFRQVMHYVRPGAVRISATSGDASLRTLAFERGGRPTVILISRRLRNVVVSNLPPGTYGVCQSVRGRVYEELGTRTVGAGRALRVTLPASTVLTVYPHPGTNLPPTVTRWEARPNFLTVPRSSTRLRASATDPEGDRLSFEWAVAAQPKGANVLLDSPRSSETDAVGLTEPGQYTFRLAVRDGTHTVTRDVVLKVFEGNQPPVLIDVHNRIPVMLTLPQTRTLLRGGAHDLEGDPLTFTWRVVRQPKGAAVVLETPEKPGCKVTGMTMAGDYVFRFEVRDLIHAVSHDLTVPVYPVNRAAVISSIAASPDRVRPSVGTATLTAATSDPDGDVITHWWSLKRKPAPARPVFANQGAAQTTVSGLTVPGRYVFRLTVVDRTRFTAGEVSVTVAPRDGGPSSEE